MGKLFTVILLAILFLAPYRVSAADFDGSKPFLCAVTEAIECDEENGCRQGSLESMDIPQFVRVDLKRKKISANSRKEGEDKREAKIINFVRTDGALIMQGTQGHRAWSMVVGEKSGKMSASVSEDRVGFLLFGACTMP